MNLFWYVVSTFGCVLMVGIATHNAEACFAVIFGMASLFFLLDLAIDELVARLNEARNAE